MALRPLTSYITSHNASGQAIIHSTVPAQWVRYDDDSLAFDVVYTTSSFPVDLNGEADIKAHDDLLSSGKLRLVQPGGTVCRIVDFAPGNKALIHRTKSLDYGVVLEGEVEMILDSGETVILGRGDVAVQRGTMHGWRNTSETEWLRMLFVLQDCRPVMAGGEVLGEDLAGSEIELSKKSEK
ncbi:hypothetical protein ASPZODRAFT_146995 [Penicilliopsis zonata CBS 506.65]|uniref:Cupin type-2 domain-containing protein n=1 Tax=Penicilliopsis zonata CBS 506.65 TaxID=1073090 RepID=A0A1L9S6S3_9EURO|nr:hypothetical protein ASPZODRAFT_146995 [Penicilliopsis zonata CBS 506.65]OJJ42828.1 hypothetical protein ASPZODRAFT_146995 [Penicilliopsis zonata CBS 506.65]